MAGLSRFERRATVGELCLEAVSIWLQDGRVIQRAEAYRASSDGGTCHRR